MNKLLLVLVVLQITYNDGFTIQPKIINGSLSNPELFPYFVRLDSDAGTCGGSFLNKKWIVTAAHCLVEAENLVILIGFNGEGNYQSRYEPLNRYIHPDYIEESVANDIGLIELVEPIRSNLRVKPAKLSSDCGEYLADEHLIVVGNGRKLHNIAHDGDLRLRQAHLQSINQIICTNYLNDDQPEGSIICATSVGEIQGISQGDSGGPLLRRSDNTLIGISSFNAFNMIEPTVLFQAFTRIQFYFDWIEGVSGISMPKCE